MILASSIFNFQESYYYNFIYLIQFPEMTWIATQVWFDTYNISNPYVLEGMLGIRQHLIFENEDDKVMDPIKHSLVKNMSKYPLLLESICCTADEETARELMQCNDTSQTLDNFVRLVNNSAYDGTSLLNAVYAIAHALDGLMNETNGTCNPATCSHKLLVEQLYKVDFSHQDMHPIAFNSNGDLLYTRFDVINMQLNNENDVVASKVGEWRSDAVPKLVINDSLIKWKSGNFLCYFVKLIVDITLKVLLRFFFVQNKNFDSCLHLRC